MISRKQNQQSTVSQNMADKQKRYEALVHTYHADLYRYAYWLVKDKHIAEDIVQEAFLRAWKSLDSLNDEKAAKSWLITILRRENARRFERKQLDVVDMDDVVLMDNDVSQEGKIENRELRRHIAALNEEYREPLILQVMFGFSGEEISEQLGLNKNTVMTRLFRARNQLKEAIENDSNMMGKANG
ncbi:sigma-70 family RNA polymerase sigma factor [Paraneptunicella aestuarii]|uniref:sigma-70 family RNA polymerase sigma factor n=1 Tax=Paraneptunicella aestuarii TaxID=2831148 RepID=UPI001E62F0EB|nr:sigma-70 family RNA polymerase sigma factor [Paraneptunicella aestuarii]UAA40102.1 sigma-70 family RNA polymerase sigma factor [Paraneptunicella aestuarii]